MVRVGSVGNRWFVVPVVVTVVTVVCGLLVGVVPAAASAPPSPTTTTVLDGDSSGATLRFDTAGNAIDAHDGGLVRFGNTYYLYGTSYGCGFTWQGPGSPFCGFRVYSSPDLARWTDRGPLFDAATAAWQQACNGSTYGCFRPHVVHDTHTHRYVLWFNSYDNVVGYHVFTASQPTGPFVQAPAPTLAVNATAAPAGLNNGDENLFVDEDGTAYLTYTDWIAGGDLVVEQLDPTYLTGTGHYVRLHTRNTEAPSLFRRRNRYYLTYSDPNCGYCGGTGTSYLTASSPLGPWTGASTTSDTWQVADGGLTVTGGDIGLSRAGADWTDYTMSFDATPLQTGDGGTYAQAGWVFRATDTGTGYAWLLGNYPYQGKESGSLTKIVYRGGQVVANTTVATPFPIVGGDTYHVSTTVSGSTIRTTIDGVVVDTTTDSTYAGGRVGFREGGSDGESARFDNVVVTAPDGTVLLADDFAGTSSGGLAAWDRPAPTVTGTSITATSCGGQPDDVADLSGPNGSLYLYASDRWNNGAHNQSLATTYWEPLRFAADGAIEPLTCASSYRVTLPTDGPAHAAADPGFHSYCDVGGGVERMQSFTVSQNGSLLGVGATSFQARPAGQQTTGSPDQPLTLRLVQVQPDGTPGRTLATRSIPAAQVSWSPSWLRLSSRVPVTRGQRFAVVMSSATTTGCYGVAYSDADPVPTGQESYSADGGATWRVEAGRDLHVLPVVG